ncbi:hypothetical protein [Photorhabdus cinerea]|uniref:hypothetical protein n=1 Tax=Photorhabdus cinerea TaxID=471575 RepID=UPI0014075148|nr:hypothetical protein [Photorhabdus cinerea]
MLPGIRSLAVAIHLEIHWVYNPSKLYLNNAKTPTRKGIFDLAPLIHRQLPTA